MNRYFLPVIVLLLLSDVASAQSNARTDRLGVYTVERIHILTDRQLYLTGEVIWFKLWCMNSKDGGSATSQVAYLELISPQGVPVSRVKVGLDGAVGMGAIELPASLVSGYYTLRAYTRAMRRFGEEVFARESLILLNPEQGIAVGETEVLHTVPGSVAATEPEREALNIQYQFSSASVGPRELVSLEITTTDSGGRPVRADLAVSVALSAPVQPSAGRSRPVIPAAAAGPTVTAHQLEDRGMLLTGRVFDETNGLGAARTEVFLAFPGEIALVYVAVTDDQGNFSFLLPGLYGLRSVVLQLAPEAKSSLRIELTEDFHESASRSAPSFVLPSEWLPLANQALVNAQVQEAYRSFELPPVFHTNNPFDSIPFFGLADATYQLDDYTRFPLPEFFFEIVTEVAVRGKFGSERLAVGNEWKGALPATEPLLLVDGVPVFDQRTFLKINNKLIKTAEVVLDPFWLNPRFFNGIIQIQSFDGNGRAFRLPGNALQRSFLALLPERQFRAPDYATDPDRRLPDFRNTLYWNPSVQTNGQGKATVSFYSGDAAGDFQLWVEGIAGTITGSTRGTLRVNGNVK